MPEKTKVRIVRGGSPIVGAHVQVVPLLGTDQVTDEDGRVAFDFPLASAGWVQILVWGEGITDSAAIVQLEDLESHDFDLQPPPE